MKKKMIQEKGSFRNNLLLSLGIMVFFCVAGAVQAAQPPSSPPPRFQEAEGSNGSIIRDNTTGLEWQRCPYGKGWTGSGCSGRAWRGTWDDAVRVTAPGGFRVPTIDELKTLAPYDQGVFPGNYGFWSSSPHAYDTGDAWGLYFDYGGGARNYYKGNYYQLRLVRSGH
ncbi:DUF1566 domain-containing protein [Desulfobotulus sp.]|jgi:hypothetical protein|uniref:Lcl C-terminal domain-containing protein n=1 Tax=Desulfobotulus sp. TaxID=1940337 RepID=UPI002A35F638|nr:DUF1566 domain-containing protein [Desulfobotulus sp.]MDY0164271.1 DUF1566 domain-containing protein [Desulfobotulus sp.]